MVVEVHDQAVDNARDRLDDPIELACAHSNATAVEGGIGPAADDAGPIPLERHPIAMGPHPWMGSEVGLAIPLASCITPKSYGHGRKRRGEHQLPLLPDFGRRTVRPHGADVATEHRAGDLARPDRREGGCSDERRAHISTTAHRRQPDMPTHGLGHPPKAIGGERCSRRANLLPTPEGPSATWMQARLPA